MSDIEKERLNKRLVEVIRDEKLSPKFRFRTARYLVNLGADVNANLYGKSALVWAEKIHDFDLIDFLIEKGAKEWEISKKEAERLGREFWDWYDMDEGYVVDRALKSRKEIKELIEKGADVNFQVDNGTTALMNACEEGDRESVKMLLQNGADVKIKDVYGDTALMKACEAGDKELVKMLLQNGADVNERDKDGSTTLMKASSAGSEEVVKFLLEKGVDVNAQTNCGETALMEASWGGHINVIELLLSEGANIDLMDKSGKTAQSIAFYSKSKNRKKVLNMLDKLKRNQLKKQIKEDIKSCFKIFWGGKGK